MTPDFIEAYDAGRGALVWTVDVADLETPVAAFLKLAHGQPHSFLLESVEGGAARGRYSIIGMAPDLVWRCQDGKAALNRNALAAPDAFVTDERPALESLRALVAENRMTLPPGVPPMCGGLFGYLGYDMVRLMERLPAENPDVLGLPDAILTRPTLFAVFDTVEGRADAGGAGLPGAGCGRGDRLGAGAGADRGGAGGARPPAAACGPRAGLAAAGPGPQHGARRLRGDGDAHEGTTSSPATSSRRCRASASPPHSRCRPSRCIARCGGSTRRRSCISSISAISASLAAARRSWCACATAR